jgi:hypothetical protein
LVVLGLQNLRGPEKVFSGLIFVMQSWYCSLIICEFDLSEKIVCAVSDNAKNVKKAISDAGITGISCFAHTLNLCVEAALKAVPEFEEMRKKISEMVGFLHKAAMGKKISLLVRCA